MALVEIADVGKPIRRHDGGLVKAHAFAIVVPAPLPSPQPQHWRHPEQRHGARDLTRSANKPGKSDQQNALADAYGYGLAWHETDEEIPNQPSAGRSLVITTDRELQLGPPPGRISRQNDDRISALIGPQKQNTLPTDSNWAYIPHHPASRLLHGATPHLRSVADEARIPAVFVGNPLG